MRCTTVVGPYGENEVNLDHAIHLQWICCLCTRSFDILPLSIGPQWRIYKFVCEQGLTMSNAMMSTPMSPNKIAKSKPRRLCGITA